jgi:hypothetical protein
MKNLQDGLPVIIHEDIHFSCFGGIAKGDLIIDVHDNGTTNFSTTVTANTNLGSGSVIIDLSGNKKITKKVSGVEIQVEVSQWKCSKTELSFHLKAKAKKSFLSCKIVDKTLQGKRFDNEEFESKLAKCAKEAESVEA